MPDELEILAMESVDACKTIMQVNMVLIPMLAYRAGGEVHEVLLPESMLAIYDDRDMRPLIFEAMAAMLERKNADLAIWMSEATQADIRPETVKRMSRPELERIANKGATWMAEHGFCTTRQVLSVVAQTRERMLMVSVPFVRYLRSIRFGDPEITRRKQCDVPEHCNNVKLFREVKIAGN